ncbi:hypothetical protein [Streptomyces chattanoogensis]|uniref:hypothetical protein n=1 Tax=Streptomyces chattanoogensis TaxID=66876 RepID=UPI0036AE9623
MRLTPAIPRAAVVALLPLALVAGGTATAHAAPAGAYDPGHITVSPTGTWDPGWAAPAGNYDPGYAPDGNVDPGRIARPADWPDPGYAPDGYPEPGHITVHPAGWVDPSVLNSVRV